MAGDLKQHDLIIYFPRSSVHASLQTLVLWFLQTPILLRLTRIFYQLSRYVISSCIFTQKSVLCTGHPSTSVSVSPTPGRPLRQHPPEHAGDEQRAAGHGHDEQRGRLSKLCHVLRRLRNPVPQAAGLSGWLWPPPQPGPPRAAEPPRRRPQPRQLPPAPALVQAEAQNPRPDRRQHH